MDQSVGGSVGPEVNMSPRNEYFCTTLKVAQHENVGVKAGHMVIFLHQKVQYTRSSRGDNRGVL